MARTIEVKYKNLIRKLVASHYGSVVIQHLEDIVFAKVPPEAFNTWEEAHDEIRRIIWDEISERRNQC